MRCARRRLVAFQLPFYFVVPSNIPYDLFAFEQNLSANRVLLLQETFFKNSITYKKNSHRSITLATRGRKIATTSYIHQYLIRSHGFC